MARTPARWSGLHSGFPMTMSCSRSSASWSECSSPATSNGVIGPCTTEQRCVCGGIVVQGDETPAIMCFRPCAIRWPCTRHIVAQGGFDGLSPVVLLRLWRDGDRVGDSGRGRGCRGSRVLEASSRRGSDQGSKSSYGIVITAQL